MFQFRSAVAVAGLLLITACASDHPPPRPHPGPQADRDDGDDPADRFGTRAMLFVSPSGEPFRGKPGEPYPVAAWFRQADANADGHLDRAEFVADAQRFFQRLDVNGDGAIDSLELQNYEHRIVPEILSGPGAVGRIDPPAAIIRVSDIILVQMGGGGGMGGGGMGGGGGGGRRGGKGGGSKSPDPTAPPRSDTSMAGAAPYNLLREPEPVAASDLSFTGRITVADFKRRAEQRFDTLDTDKQGFLTLESLPKTTVQDRAAGGGQRRRRQPPPQT
jgi:hypothetical protein